MRALKFHDSLGHLSLTWQSFTGCCQSARKAVVSGRRALNAIPSSLDVLAALDGEIFESKNYRIQLKRTTWAAKSRIDSREVKNPQVSMLINSSVSLACD